MEGAKMVDEDEDGIFFPTLKDKSTGSYSKDFTRANQQGPEVLKPLFWLNQ